MLDTIRIRKDGFPMRKPLKEFNVRYNCLTKIDVQSVKKMDDMIFDGFLVNF